MCGRATLTVPSFEELARLLGVPYDAELAARYRPRFNMAPSDEHWIVAPFGSTARSLLPAKWGLSIGPKRLPNVRGEHAHKQLKNFAHARCLVPVDGFFEWSGDKGARVPHWFHPAQPHSLLLLAGVYGEGPEGFDFTVLTTKPNAAVAKVHDRMPVVIPTELADQWLRGDQDEALSLVKPAPDDLLVDTVVSTRANSARNDDPECLLPPTDAEAPRQRKLF